MDRFTVIAAVQGAQLEAHREQTRVRGFRNVILGVAVVIFIVAAIVAMVGLFSPLTFPLCFAPESSGSATVVCPLGQSHTFPATSTASTPTTPGPVPPSDPLVATVNPLDILAIEFIGALGATIAAAAGLRRIRASADPYSLGVALAVLKLPTGALTAFLGLLLIRSGLVIGLSALDTSAQIVAWAITLGFSQQLFTRFVDQQAQDVLQEADRGHR